MKHWSCQDPPLLPQASTACSSGTTDSPVQPTLAVGEQEALAHGCSGPSIVVGDGDVASRQLQRAGRCLAQGDLWLDGGAQD